MIYLNTGHIACTVQLSSIDKSATIHSYTMKYNQKLHFISNLPEYAKVHKFNIQHLRSKAQKSKQDFGKKHPARLSKRLKASRPVRKNKQR